MRETTAIASLVPLVFVAAGISLLFHRLHEFGVTWDEWTDYRITASFANPSQILDNSADPSQGRLQMLWAAAAEHVWGVSVPVFKTSFAALGPVLALALFAAVRKRATLESTLYAVAILVLSPGFLSAFRYGATAGDSFVLIGTFGLVTGIAGWIRRGWHLAPAVVTGFWIGFTTATKLTSAIFVAAPFLALGLAGRVRTRRDLRMLASDGALCLLVSAFTTLAGSPHLARGIAVVREMSDGNWCDRVPTYLVLGAARTKFPWQYFVALFVAKIGLGVAFLFFLAIVLVAAGRSNHGASERPTDGLESYLVAAAVVAFLGYAPVFRRFQSAQYYLPETWLVVLVCTVAFDRLVTSDSRAVRTTVRVLACAALGLDLSLLYRLHGDFLQSGREFGPAMQGEFWGPAVNHCQGSGAAILALRRIPAVMQRDVVYVAGCGYTFELEATAGATRFPIRVTEYDYNHPPARPYVVGISGIFLSGNYSQGARDAQNRHARELARTCRTVYASPTDAFRFFDCE